MGRGSRVRFLALVNTLRNKISVTYMIEVYDLPQRVELKIIVVQDRNRSKVFVSPGEMHLDIVKWTTKIRVGKTSLFITKVDKS